MSKKTNIFRHERRRQGRRVFQEIGPRSVSLFYNYSHLLASIFSVLELTAECTNAKTTIKLAESALEIKVDPPKNLNLTK